MIGLDGFEVVGDSLGQEAGDDVLKHVALARTEPIPLGDTAVRLGREAVVGVAEEFDTDDGPMFATADIPLALSRPLQVCGRTLSVTASLGTAKVPDPGQTLKTALFHAETAMSEHKRLEAAASAAACVARTSTDILGASARGIKAKRLVPDHQPVVNFCSGRSVGFEALVDGRHHDKGLLMPADFVALAERDAILSSVDKAKFDRVCRDLAV